MAHTLTLCITQHTFFCTVHTKSVPLTLSLACFSPFYSISKFPLLNPQDFSLACLALFFNCIMQSIMIGWKWLYSIFILIHVYGVCFGVQTTPKVYSRSPGPRKSAGIQCLVIVTAARMLAVNLHLALCKRTLSARARNAYLRRLACLYFSYGTYS